MPLLEYIKWENFHKVIKQSIIACKESNYNIIEHFPEVRKPIKGVHFRFLNDKDENMRRKIV